MPSVTNRRPTSSRAQQHHKISGRTRARDSADDLDHYGLQDERFFSSSAAAATGPSSSFTSTPAAAVTNNNASSPSRISVHHKIISDDCSPSSFYATTTMADGGQVDAASCGNRTVLPSSRTIMPQQQCQIIDDDEADADDDDEGEELILPLSSAPSPSSRSSCSRMPQQQQQQQTLLQIVNSHVAVGDVHGVATALLLFPITAAAPSSSQSQTSSRLAAAAVVSAATASLTTEYRFNWSPKERDVFDAALRLCFSTFCDTALHGTLWSSESQHRSSALFLFTLVYSSSKNNIHHNNNTTNNRNNIDCCQSDAATANIIGQDSVFSETVTTNAAFAASHFVSCALSAMEHSILNHSKKNTNHTNNNDKQDDTDNSLLLQSVHSVVHTLLQLAPTLFASGVVPPASIGRLIVHRINQSTTRGVEAIECCGAAALLFVTCWLSHITDDDALFQLMCEQTVVRIGVALRARITGAKKRARQCLVCAPCRDEDFNSDGNKKHDESRTSSTAPSCLSTEDLTQLNATLHRSLKSWNRTAPARKAFASTPLTGGNNPSNAPSPMIDGCAGTAASTSSSTRLSSFNNQSCHQKFFFFNSPINGCTPTFASSLAATPMSAGMSPPMLA